MPDSESSTETEPNRTAAGSSDPQDIHSIAVTVEDVVTALEANLRVDRRAVLRITPPFAGRMRARLHVDGGEGAYDGDIQPIHIDPENLVSDVPAYPTADETAEPDDDLDARRRRHTDGVSEWRETVRNRLTETVTVPHNGESLALRVLQLG